METFLRTWLEWPSVAAFISKYTWAWPLGETFHFFGIILLIGGVGMFDLRLLGVARQLPVAAVKRLLPWGVTGFILCVVTGLMFVTGVRANVPSSPYDVIRVNPWLQMKFVFLGLAGLNLLAFYVTGMNRKVDDLGPGASAPVLAKVIAAASLFFWLGVIYFGRLIPEGL
jgi:hypothetical protein